MSESVLDFSASNAERRTPFVDRTRRVCDVCLAIGGLVVFAPLFLLIAVRIKLDSPGPVLYRGPRSGKGNDKFAILKFRTMYERKSSYEGPRVTAKGDRRITPFGTWLRDTKLNELPQLWNVLKGEMSFVGPRPEDPEIVATWPEAVRREILSLRPGISSPASILFREEETLLKREDVMDDYMASVLPSKQRLDELYVRHRSLWLDMDVILWTLLVLVPGLGRADPGEESIYWGPAARFVRRYATWFVADAGITLVSFVIGMLVPALFFRESQLSTPSIILPLIFVLVFSLVGVLVGANRIVWSRASLSDALDLVPGWIVATVATVTASYELNRMSGKTIGISVFTFFVLAVVVRFRRRLLTSLMQRSLMLRAQPMQSRERVLIVGSGESAQFAAWQLLHSPSALHAFRVIGYVDDDIRCNRLRIGGISVLGTTADTAELVKRHDIGIVVFAIHNIKRTERNRLLESCRRTEAHVVDLPDYLGQIQGVVRGCRDYNTPSVRDAVSNIPPRETVSREALDRIQDAMRSGDYEIADQMMQSLRQSLDRYSEVTGEKHAHVLAE